MRTLLFLLLVSCAFSQSPIKHVVVLMLENRSFDHMLGHLKQFNPEVDGLVGNETNPYDPFDPTSPKVRVSFDSPDLIGMNPGHSVGSTEIEIWGSSKKVAKPTMNGFIKELLQSNMSPSEAANVMRCYNSSSLPAMSTLAMEFGVFDRWYASIPGPTQPNRMYLHSCTSHGAASNPLENLIEGFPQRTIYDDLYAAGVDWAIYFSDFPVCLTLRRIRDYPLHVKILDDFIDDCKAGTLPAYSFIEPRWFDFLDWDENDDHPPHSVAAGEFLIKEIYEALRASPNWNETLFIITFDEHGGLYDHVPPPQKGVPNPDGLNSTDPVFGFDRLGLRVPTVMVSPWIDQRTVVHEASRHHFDHTSIAGTVRKMFNIHLPPLTKREAWSGTFETLFNVRKTPRTDCPTTIPVPAGLEKQWDKYIRAQRTRETPENIKKMIERNPAYVTDSPPINDLQQEVVNIAWSLTGGKEVDRPNFNTVHEAALYVRKQYQTWREAAIAELGK